jgi:hypothetical protein
LTAARKKLATSSRGQLLDLDVIAEGLDFGGEALYLGGLGAALEVIGARVSIEYAVGDHAIGGGEDRGGVASTTASAIMGCSRIRAAP